MLARGRCERRAWFCSKGERTTSTVDDKITKLVVAVVRLVIVS